MRNYSYRAVNNLGSNVKGEMIAINLDSLEDRLKEMDLHLLFASEKNNLKMQKSGGFKRRDLIDVFMEIKIMYQAGIPIHEATKATAEEIDNEKLKQIFTEITLNMESGIDLNSSMANFPKHFDEMTISVIKVGEETGLLDQALDFITEYYEWYDELVSEVKQAAVEPIVLITGIFVFIGIIFGFVLPKFLTMIQRMNVELPLPTVIMISISDFLDNYWMLVIGMIIMVISTLVFMNKNVPRFKLEFDRRLLEFPVFGKVIKMICLSSFFHNFVIQIEAGIPIIDAMLTSAKATNNKYIERGVLRARESIIHGDSIAESFRKEKDVFNNMVVRMIAAGEETGSLSATLTHVYKHYDKIVPKKIKMVMSILRPLILFFLAGVVLILALSIFLPMLGLIDNFSR